MASAACEVHVLQDVKTRRKQPAEEQVPHSRTGQDWREEDTKHQALPTTLNAGSASRVSPGTGQLEWQPRGLQNARGACRFAEGSAPDSRGPHRWPGICCPRRLKVACGQGNFEHNMLGPRHRGRRLLCRLPLSTSPKQRQGPPPAGYAQCCATLTPIWSDFLTAPQDRSSLGIARWGQCCGATGPAQSEGLDGMNSRQQQRQLWQARRLAVLCWQGSSPSMFSSVEGTEGCAAEDTVLLAGMLTQSYLLRTGELAKQVGSLLQTGDHHLQCPPV